jgi:hypothetical protein
VCVFSSFKDELQLQLKLFQLYHNRQELIEKRDLAQTKRDEVHRLEQIKNVTDEEMRTKKKELAIYNRELANDEQKIKELVKPIRQ